MTTASAEPPRRPAGTRSGTRSHVVHRFLGRLHEVLDTVSTDTAWALSPDDLTQCLQEAYAAQTRLAALTLGLVAQADRTDLATHHGQVNLVAWLREHVLLAPAEGKRQVTLARALEHHPLTRAAVATGRVPAASAAVITSTLDTLPADTDSGVDPELIERAETYLAGEAHTHDTHTLRRLAAHLDEVIDPDGADARLAEQLARAEQQAARQTFLTLHHDQTNAVTTGTFRIPLLHGAKLQRMLHAHTNPGRPDPIPTTDPTTGLRLTPEERRGHALTQLLDRIPTTKLPQLGGSAPTVVVTMSLRTLLGDLKAAHLDTGHTISPGQARRLAAQAGIIPAVLGTSDQVLDLGRKARFHTKAQRLAMLTQQNGTCAVQACTRTAAGADAAHLTPWSQGGPTDLTNSALLCPRHHTLADHPDYRIEHIRPGRIRIHRRC